MRESRNPFRLRRSESIDTDTTFLSLFEPGILDVLEDRGLPTNVQLIRSAAGGGKTSLLRLFTPSVLRRLHVRRSEENELVSKLQSLGAIDETGPTVLGVMLLCGRNYTGLDDLKVEMVLKERLFVGLLNARILLAVLRSALAFRELRYPQDLGRLEIAAGRPGDALPDDLELPVVGTSCTVGPNTWRSRSAPSLTVLVHRKRLLYQVMKTSFPLRLSGLTLSGSTVSRSLETSS